MGTSKNLVIIAGPTAAGKTDTAIALARALQCPIISADSRQVYKELGIGVAKPNAEQLAAVKHYFIDHVSMYSGYNAGTYGDEARALISELFKTHNYVIVCGGTGLYIKAITEGFDKLPPKDEKLRDELKAGFEAEGIVYLQNKLRKLDPEAYEKTEQLNPQRLIRAIEIAVHSPDYAQKEIPGTPALSKDINIIRIGITLQRQPLYERINTRVDNMVKAGLEEEARSLNHLRHLNAMLTVGYTEWFIYFDGDISREQAIELVKQNTRRYAKRQLTWFRNQEKMTWFEPGNTAGILEYISKAISLQS